MQPTLENRQNRLHHIWKRRCHAYCDYCDYYDLVMAKQPSAVAIQSFFRVLYKYQISILIFLITYRTREIMFIKIFSSQT